MPLYIGTFLLGFAVGALLWYLLTPKPKPVEVEKIVYKDKPTPVVAELALNPDGHVVDIWMKDTNSSTNIGILIDGTSAESTYGSVACHIKDVVWAHRKLILKKNATWSESSDSKDLLEAIGTVRQNTTQDILGVSYTFRFHYGDPKEHRGKGGMVFYG